MNRKKLGITSLSLILLVIMAIIGFEIMLIIFTKMSAIDINEVRMEAEKGYELIRIYISIDEYKKGHPDEEETRITINNEWGKTSIIDYFTIEDWDGNIISKGNFTPPIVLGAGEIRVYKGNDILNTFKLNNENYTKFWFFKDHIRSIDLHTVFGNTFGSCYKHVGEFTITQENIIIRPTLITFNQTITTTYYNTYALIVESYGPFNFSSYSGDNPHKYYIDVHEYQGSSETDHYIVGLVPPLSGYIPRYYIVQTNYNDGFHQLPKGLVVTVNTQGGFVGMSTWEIWVWDTAHYNYIPSQGWFTGVKVYLDRQELWELDENAEKEVRLVNSTNSESITFIMDKNYKLKRYFRADVSQYIPPPPPPPPPTATTTGGEQPITKYTKFHFIRSKGLEQSKDVTITPMDPQRWYIKYLYYKVTQGEQYLENKGVDYNNDKYLSLYLRAWVKFKPDTLSNDEVEITVWYLEWPRGW